MLLRLSRLVRSPLTAHTRAHPRNHAHCYYPRFTAETEAFAIERDANAMPLLILRHVRSRLTIAHARTHSVALPPFTEPEVIAVQRDANAILLQLRASSAHNSHPSTHAFWDYPRSAETEVIEEFRYIGTVMVPGEHVAKIEVRSA